MPRLLTAAYAAALIALCACDFIWLGVVARHFYQTQIGALLLPDPNWGAAAIFYPLYTGGIVIFCVAPALARDSWPQALWRGALFGLVAYATYDLSNLATLKGWPAAVTVVDLVWGMLVSATAATAGFLAARAARPRASGVV